MSKANKTNNEPAPPTKKVRVDKWLWAVRIFKTRTIATDACKAGKIKINGNTLKASFEVRIGDTLQVKKESFNLTFKVTDILEKRVSAPMAAMACENLTPPEEMEKFRLWFVEIRDRGTGRPTKRDRRDIDDFKAPDSIVLPTETPNDFSWISEGDDDED
jgi:ribosome-associated heat shock protein Hsp15